MSIAVYWQLELNIKPGKLDDVKALTDDMSVYTTQHEPGVLNYEWTRNSAGTECHIYERYKDSHAVMTHLGGFQEHFAGRFFEIFDIKRWTLYGNPSEEVRAALSGLGAECFETIGGFVR